MKIKTFFSSKTCCHNLFSQSFIVLDYTMGRVTSGSKRIHWNTFKKLCDLDYADDIVVLSHSMLEMKGLLDELSKCAGEVGLLIKIAKSKLMRNQPTTTRTRSSSVHLTLGGEAIEEVDKFVYLGSVISASGGAEEDILNRIRLANVAFSSLRHIWSSNRLSLRLKLKFFNSNVKSVLMYGCETWKVTETLNNKLQVFVNKCLRSICGIFYPDLISNTDLHARIGQCLIAKEIGLRKWGWIGHTLRKGPDDIARQAMSWNSLNKRKPGRPPSPGNRPSEVKQLSRAKKILSWRIWRRIA
jgi:hypothetical protein